MNHFAAPFADPKILAEQRLGCGRAETHDNLRLNDADFRIEPWSARRDLARIWLLVQAPLSGRFPFEVLDGVGDLIIVTIDSNFIKDLVEQLA